MKDTHIEVKEQELCVECKKPIPTYRTYFCEECYAHMVSAWKGGTRHGQDDALCANSVGERIDVVAKGTYPFNN